MSGIFPEYQPISFSPTTDNCETGTDELQTLAQLADTIQFQVKVSPCVGAQNVIAYPTFDSSFSTSRAASASWIRSGFSVSDNLASIAIGAAGYLKQFNSFVIGDHYLLEVKIASLTGSVFVMNGADTLKEITKIGLTKISFTATSTDIRIETRDAVSAVTVEEVSARQFSNSMGFCGLDSDGTTILSVFTLGDNPEYFTFVEDTVTIKVTHTELSGGTTGCKYIGFADGCSNLNGQFGIPNGDFISGLPNIEVAQTASSLPYWENTGAMSADVPIYEWYQLTTGVNTGAVFFNGAGGETWSIINTGAVLKTGVTYTVTIGELVTVGTVTLEIYCGTAYHSFTTSNESADITCTGTTDFIIKASFTTGGDITLAGVSMVLKTPNADFEPDYVSNAFLVKETHECSYLLNLSNDKNAFGLIFEGVEFAPTVRVSGELKNDKPDTNRKVYLDDNGNKRVYFAEVRTIKSLGTEPLPKRVLRFLMACCIADHFFIDGEEYFIEDENISLEYVSQMPDISQLLIQVSQKTQLFRNTSISSSLKPVLANQDTFFLADPQDIDVNIIVEPYSTDYVLIK